MLDFIETSLSAKSEPISTWIFYSLLIVILVLFAIYVCWFLICKWLFKKELKLKEKYNVLNMRIYSISFAKIEVLAKNNPDLQINLANLKDANSKLKQNASILQEDIIGLTNEIFNMRLLSSRNIIKALETKLNDLQIEYDKFFKKFNECSVYSNAIAELFNFYGQFFTVISAFYKKSIDGKFKFKQIDAKFLETSKLIKVLSELSIHFDYDKTLKALKSLKENLIILYKIVKLINSMQIVQGFLKKAIERFNELILTNYSNIEARDFEVLSKLLNIFKEETVNLNTNLSNFKLKEANDSAISAINYYGKINEFIQINIKSPRIIKGAIDVIYDQIKSIYENKDKIVFNLNSAKQFFWTDELILKSIDVIVSSIDNICSKYSSINAVALETHSQKLSILKELRDISLDVSKNKDVAVTEINKINGYLNKTLGIIEDLSNLFVFLHQIHSIVLNEEIFEEYSVNEDALLIQTSLKTIQDCTDEVLNNKQYDHTKIHAKIDDIADQTEQFCKKINGSVILKFYASKLFSYSNRYVDSKTIKPMLSKAKTQYNSKQYSACIDTLLLITKKAKRTN